MITSNLPQGCNSWSYLILCVLELGWTSRRTDNSIHKQFPTLIETTLKTGNQLQLFFFLLCFCELVTLCTHVYRSWWRVIIFSISKHVLWIALILWGFYTKFYYFYFSTLLQCVKYYICTVNKLIYIREKNSYSVRLTKNSLSE